jgi:mannose-6-phosphate isomerase
VALAPNLPETFYAGSGRLARFHGEALPQRPEEWVASTTRRYGQPTAGLSELPDGSTLLDAITAEPQQWLGRSDADTGLLVKLLDAGQRLPLHVHPDRAFARTHLASPYGKTEAWIIVDALPGATVNLGFRRDVEPDELARWVETQDIAAMLAATHEVPVHAGDAVLCPAGTPHAIGADILLVELQEPTDLSIMLETEGFPIAPDDASLGLSRDTALACVNRSGITGAQLREWMTATAGSMLPAAAAEFFRAEPVADGASVHGFAVLIVTEGAGVLAGPWGATDIRRGSTLVLPFAAGPARVTGSVSGVLCAPPRELPLR